MLIKSSIKLLYLDLIVLGLVELLSAFAFLLEHLIQSWLLLEDLILELLDPTALLISAFNHLLKDLLLVLLLAAHNVAL
jgi:hypothetical protein